CSWECISARRCALKVKGKPAGPSLRALRLVFAVNVGSDLKSGFDRDVKLPGVGQACAVGPHDQDAVVALVGIAVLEAEQLASRGEVLLARAVAPVHIQRQLVILSLSTRWPFSLAEWPAVIVFESFSPLAWGAEPESARKSRRSKTLSP